MARRMLKKAGLHTHPTLTNISPARPESAKTASSPWGAPCPKQGRSELSILLIAYPDEQVVGSQPILSDTGLRIEREMSGGVCDWLELMCQRQGLCIDK